MWRDLTYPTGIYPCLPQSAVSTTRSRDYPLPQVLIYSYTARETVRAKIYNNTIVEVELGVCHKPPQPCRVKCFLIKFIYPLNQVVNSHVDVILLQVETNILLLDIIIKRNLDICN